MIDLLKSSLLKTWIVYKSDVYKSFICQWPELKSLLKSTRLTKCLSKHGEISNCRCALRMYWQVMWEPRSAVPGSQRAVSWVSWYSMCNLRPLPDRQIYLNELNYWFRPFFRWNLFEPCSLKSPNIIIIWVVSLLYQLQLLL